VRKALIGICLIFIVVFARRYIGWLFSRDAILSKISGTINVRRIGAGGESIRDEFGVPHIVAQSEYDAFFTVGFTHAQDRLWQMELTRRVGMGAYQKY